MAFFELFVENTLLFLQDWGFLIVILFGVLHPLFENPLHLFNFSIAIALLGIPIGILVVAVSNVIGILLLYYFTRVVNDKSDNYFQRRKVSSSILRWVKETETWKHIIVIGVPLIPTYPVKVAVPLSGIAFKKYMITLCGAYLFLFFSNSLIYFGALGFLTNTIPTWISYILVLLLIVIVYFGKYIVKKEVVEVEQV